MGTTTDTASGEKATGDQRQHTPSPWDYWHDPISGLHRIRHPIDGGANRKIIGHVLRKEDARLTTAAPELLAALLTCYCPRPVNSRPENEIVTVESCYAAGECGCDCGTAIAKAERD